MATQKATSVPSKRLAGSILSTDMSFKLNNILSWVGIVDGTTNLTSADFGTRAFGVFRNSTNTVMELFEFDPSTIASASITIIARGLSYSGATTGAAVASYNFNANETIVELGSHTPQLFEQYMDKTSDETVTGVKTFSSSPVVPTPSNPTDAANKAYADALAIAGSPDSTTTTKGISKMSVAPASPSSPIAVGDNDGRVSTQGENDAQVGDNTDIAVGSGNKFITQTGLQKQAEIWAIDAAGSDTYAITLSPVPTSYATGMPFRFKAGTLNTGASTLNINALGAKTLKKIVAGGKADTETGDILAGQIVEGIYDGTDMVICSRLAGDSGFYANGVITRDFTTASGAVNTAHGLGRIPKFVRFSAIFVSGSTPSTGRVAQSFGSYNGTTNAYTRVGVDLNGGVLTNASGTGIAIYIIYGTSGADVQSAVATFDATNIILTWTKSGTTTSGNIEIMYEVLA